MEKRKCLLFITILVIGAALFLQSCVSESKLNRLCAGRSVVVKDSIRLKDSLVITRRDSLYTIAAKDGPADTIKSPCDSIGRLMKFDIVETKNGLTTEIKSDGKTITYNCREKELEILLHNANIKTEIYKNAFEQVVKKENCPLRHHTKYDTISNWGFPILLLLILVFLYLRIKR